MFPLFFGLCQSRRRREGEWKGGGRKGGTHTSRSPEPDRAAEDDLAPVQGRGAAGAERGEDAREQRGGEAPGGAGAQSGQGEGEGRHGEVGEGAGEVVKVLGLEGDGGEGAGGLEGIGGGDGGDEGGEEGGFEVCEVEEGLDERHFGSLFGVGREGKGGRREKGDEGERD